MPQPCTLPSRFLKDGPKMTCPSGHGECMRTTSPDGKYVGINTFDTFFWSLLTVFECITMEASARCLRRLLDCLPFAQACRHVPTYGRRQATRRCSLPARCPVPRARRAGLT